MTSEHLNYPTWKKYIVLSASIDYLKVKDKRTIFALIRQHATRDEQAFFPDYGFTAGAFCAWQILSDTRRPRRRRRGVGNRGATLSASDVDDDT
tara:strand:- start:564 stop:845 length:282 start_codon:yes stop_codon:yes gene_type:complete